MNRRQIIGYVVLWIRIAFGSHALVSGLNHFLEVLPLPPFETSPAGVFIAEMSRVGLYDLIKVVEILVGLCLIFNVYVPTALVIEFPITVSIFYLNVFVDQAPRRVFTGSRELFYNVFLLAAYAGYYSPMLRLKAELRELWR